MSDTEEDFRFFGTPLEPYDEDSFPSKKPISIEEQSARDAQGRRRFHGAFTGGFSAGFFNTVGSLEGWRPQEFKSSRSEKAHNVRQKPEDFMDDEDMGEFGIAPQVVQATSDYSSGNSKKRKRPMVLNEGPIPGEPVLESLLQAGNETVGYFLMKNISRKHKSRETNSSVKVYGCQMPKDLPNEMNEMMDDDDIQYELHQVYKTFLANPKTNTFGLGYVGLSRTFGIESRPAHLSGTERNNKKFSISGPAFGVGAFEDEDDDIYVKDDMSRYDFEMSAENVTPKLKDSRSAGKTIFDIFLLSTKTAFNKNVFPPPTIPNSFTGKYKTKKSRFAPPEKEAVPERKSMDATVRASFLGENVEKIHTPSNQQHKKPTEAAPAIAEEPKIPDIKKEVAPIFPGLMLDRFVSAQLNEDTHNILEVVKLSESEHGTKEMRDAVNLKMFGPLTHSVSDWQPCSFLCRKFDVPEPNVDSSMVKTKKRTKNLIFEYQKHAENIVDLKPGLSVTKEPEPVVVPKEEPQDAVAMVPEVLPIIEQPQSVEEVKKVEVIDLTERVDVAKNVDLFKSVFLSSDESDAEEEVEEHKTEEITESVVLEPLIPTIKTKEGILSNLDFSKFNSAPINKEVMETVVEIAPDIYGPKLPTKLQSVNSVVVKQPVVNEDEWVEKGSEKKHKKKHKKEKRKKHKHKSKRRISKLPI